MVCKGGRRKLLLFLLCEVTTQYVCPPFLPSVFVFSALIRYTERCGILKGKEKNEWCVAGSSVKSILVVYCFLILFTTVAMTRAKRHLVSFFLVLYFIPLSMLICEHLQCVVGDSSTVCHGSKYLKKWIAWLDANADVRYAGLE